MQIMGKETLSNCCCGNLGESSCEVEKNNFCPVCGKQGTLVKKLMSNRLHIFHPKDSCDNTFIRLINEGIF